MFDFIRTHQRLMQLLLLLFIFPSFAFFGLSSYTSMADNDNNAVAKVAGEKITQQDWDVAQRQQLDRMRQMFGDKMDTKLLDTPETRRAVLDNLIAQRAMIAEVARNKLQVSDQTLAQTLLAIPGLVKADGTFDNDQYKTLLGAQGMTPPLYEARLRQDLALQQLNSAVQASAFAPKAVAARLSDLNDQERVVQQLLFKDSAYASQAAPDEAAMKAYYDQHGALFQVPEQAKIEYLVLDNAAVAGQITVSDADINSYYEQNQKLYGSPEERRASHILVAVKKDASAADKAAAKAKAEKLSAQLIANPADFAKVAKTASDDPGSAAQGGDLGYFGPGMMVKPFEDAAFQMKQGQISAPVQSDFGYHVIQLTGIKPARVKPLEQVKGDIALAIKTQLSAKKYAEMADIFNNTVYEQGDSLKPAADKLKLSVATASNVTRQPVAAAAAQPYNNPKFLAALFADDVVRNKHNTEVIEIAPNTLIAGRIVEYKPVSKRPYEEVKTIVRERVIQAQEAVLAKKAGEQKLAALKGKDDTAGFGEAVTISRVKDQGLSPDTVIALMKADTSTLPAYVGLELPGQGYGVFRIAKVAQPATPDAARRTAEAQQVAEALAQQEMLAYLNVLKEKAKVKILKAASKPQPAAPEL